MFQSLSLVLLILIFTCRGDDTPKTKDVSWLYQPRSSVINHNNQQRDDELKKRWRPYAAREMLFHGTNTNWQDAASINSNKRPIVPPPVLHKPESSKYYLDNRPNLFGMEKGEFKEKLVDKLHATLLGIGNLVLTSIASIKTNKTILSNKCDLAPEKINQTEKNVDNDESYKPHERRYSNDTKDDLAWVDEGRQMAIRVGRLFESASNLMSKDFKRELSPEEKKEFEKQKLELKELQNQQEIFWRKVKHAIKYGN